MKIYKSISDDEFLRIINVYLKRNLKKDSLNKRNAE